MSDVDKVMMDKHTFRDLVYDVVYCWEDAKEKDTKEDLNDIIREMWDHFIDMRCEGD